MKEIVEEDAVREGVLLNRIKIKNKLKMELEIDEKYDALTTVMLFFVFAIVGWILEFLWMALREGVIANRGTLIGPWLPIYGYTCIGILHLYSSDRFKKITRNPLFTFLSIMIICSLTEYITSVVLEAIYGLRWWDYSKELFNINGRICLENSVLFGIGGCLCLYKIAPMLKNILNKIPKKTKILVLTILIVLFVCDNVYCVQNPHTGDGITEQIFIETLKLV